jgi:hypothetical protein
MNVNLMLLKESLTAQDAQKGLYREREKILKTQPA